MMDHGIPFTTEPNSLMEVIPQPNLMNKMKSSTGQSTISSTMDQSNSVTPWRKTGVKYATNEIYLDVIEEINCTLESNGNPSTLEVSGEIVVMCRLSGMPDCQLNFNNPQVIDDVSFHPCVRYNRYEQNKVISFVPPDGPFKLMNYRVKGQIQLPLTVKPQISFQNGVGRVNVLVTSRVPQKQMEDVVVIIPFPKQVVSTNLSANFGAVRFDEITKILTWTIGKIPGNFKEKTPLLEGSVSLEGNVVPDPPVLQVDFKISMHSASGLKVDSLNVLNENYKPYKGVRAITKAGKIHVRC